MVFEGFGVSLGVMPPKLKISGVAAGFGLGVPWGLLGNFNASGSSPPALYCLNKVSDSEYFPLCKREFADLQS